MKIIHTPVRIFTTGGVENYVRCLSKELAAVGHEVGVICSDRSDGQSIPDCIDVKPLKFIGKVANTDITPSLPLQLLREDFDILHTHIPTPWSADWSALASMLKEKPLVLTYHNDIVGKGLMDYVANLYNHSALKILLRTADRIIIARNENRSHKIKNYVDKIRVIPIGVDTKAFEPIDVELLGDIFFLGIMDEFHMYKGLDILLKALKIVKVGYPHVKLLVGGSGALSCYYNDLAKRLGLHENVEFLGFVPGDALKKHYNGCKIFVLPSTDPAQEGFGIVLLEAMSCGRPVIATDIAGAAEDIKKSSAGLVVGRKSEVELAKAILFLLDNEDFAAEMGSSARRLVEEKYSWKMVAHQTEKVYRELV
jgi:glycosyltransferase involved in cell wall biosynthesis